MDVDPRHADLEGIAWRILSDLCRPGGEFGRFPPDALQQIIGLRLVEEARRANVPPEALGLAFERAMREFTGADRPPRQPETTDDPPEPLETIDDL